MPSPLSTHSATESGNHYTEHNKACSESTYWTAAEKLQEDASTGTQKDALKKSTMSRLKFRRRPRGSEYLRLIPSIKPDKASLDLLSLSTPRVGCLAGSQTSCTWPQKQLLPIQSPIRKFCNSRLRIQDLLGWGKAISNQRD